MKSHPQVERRNLASGPQRPDTSLALTPEEMNAHLLSFIVTVRDKQETLETLHRQIRAHVPAGFKYEVIFVDDGSFDDSWAVIQALSEVYPNNVRGLKLPKDTGVAAALTAGFRASRGEIVFTMAADLQDDPQDIPRFLAQINEGYDLVSGYQQLPRSRWQKLIPIRIHRRIRQVELLEDSGDFRCYRAALAKQLTLLGELHRMVPALASMKGFRVGEIMVTHDVTHDESQQTKRHFPIRRLLRGLGDLLTIGFLRCYRQRPSHFMSTMALCCLLVGGSLNLAGISFGPGSAKGTIYALISMLVSGLSVAAFLAGALGKQITRGGHQSTWQPPIVEATCDIHDKTQHVDPNPQQHMLSRA